MATIWGSATGKNADRVNVWIEWNETQIDYENNRSYVVADFYAQTKPTATSETYDGQGRAWFYVNDNQVDYRYGLIDFRSPARPLNHLGHWEGWVNHDGNGNASVGFSGNFTIASTYINGGSASGTANLTVIWTAASAPGKPVVFATPEGSVTISWAGASAGVNNPIIGYNLYWRRNAGSLNVITLGNVTSHTFTPTGFNSGDFIDAYVQAITYRGDNPYSQFSDGVVIWTAASPATYPHFDQNPFENSLTVMWYAGTNGVNNAITGYNVYYRRNGGTEVGVYVGMTTSYTFNTSNWERGTTFDFRVLALTQKGDNPWSVWSGQVRKNRIPNTMGTPVPDKTLCQPGETLTLTFANNGDPDGNLSRIEVAASDSDTILGTAPANATSIQPNTSGMPYGATKSFRVRGVDNFGIPGSWSNVSAPVLFGVPIKVAAAQGAINRQVARMLVAATQGPINKQVVGMRVAPVQGAINRTVF